MNEQEVVIKLIEASEIFRDADLLDPLTGKPIKACLGIRFGMSKISMLENACKIFRNIAHEGIGLMMTDKVTAFEVIKDEVRIDSIIYLLKLQDYANVDRG